MSDKEHSQAGRSMFIIAWILLFILLFLFFRYYNEDGAGSYQIKQGVVTISPDQAGSYFIDGRINEHPVKFLVDTGANLVAISQKKATQLGLQGRYMVNLTTASGEVSGSLTRINDLSFADFHLKDVKAVLVPGPNDDIILLGMNVLSKFSLSQKNKQLVIKKE